MSQFPIHNHTTSLARETLAISEKTGDRSLKYMGLAMMILAGAAGLIHGVRQLWRDVAGTHKGQGNEKEHGNRPHPTPEHKPYAKETPTHAHDESQGRRWTGRGELSGRKPEADHASASHRSRSYTGQER